ncbi:MAG: ribonuclease HII [Firmicutes bacterium]|nr:ribonuclease HII [Bacillota bacterium]
MTGRRPLEEYAKELESARGAHRRALLKELEADPRRGARILLERERRRERAEREARRAFQRRFTFERRLWAAGFRRVAGVDEVGRGPLAGPVVTAAVILRPDAHIPGLDDSKRLDPMERARLVEPIRRQALAWSVVTVPPALIDELNIAQAVFLGMRRALETLRVPPDAVLVDGFRIPGLALPQEAIVGGDGLSNSIAAASVLAKVHRDRLMEIWDRRLPGYGFARHKGYATAEHLAALRALGPSPIHRRSFRWGAETAASAEQLVWPLEEGSARAGNGEGGGA